MTYNFDPDRWLDNALAALEHDLQSGRLDPARYEAETDRLLERYDDMVDRLDGTYQVDP
jgi:hypothetical protein